MSGFTGIQKTNNSFKGLDGLDAFFNIVYRYFPKTVNTSFTLPNISTNHLPCIKYFLKNFLNLLTSSGGTSSLWSRLIAV